MRSGGTAGRRARPLVEAALLLALLAPSPASAFELAWPLACRLWQDCWIVRYLDRDPGPGVRDFAGGSRSSDGHRGLDIAIADLRAMSRGVAVRAAAAGVVVGLRDGEPDVDVRRRGLAAVRGRECGNGVLLRHADGFETQYCHLRRGSIRVRMGERVPAGALLGLVGMSGKTSFPHLHLTVRARGELLDPVDSPLLSWSREAGDVRAYPLVVVTGIGLTDRAVTMEELAAGMHDHQRLDATVEALVAWVRGFWWRRGDMLRLEIAGPDGSLLFARSMRVERSRPFAFYFAGKRRRGGAWPAGIYRVRVTIRRDGRELAASRRIAILRAE